MMAARLRRVPPFLAALMLGAWLLPASSPAAEPIEVVTVILAEPNVAPGKEQIVQVTLRNNGAKPAPVGVRLLTLDENRRSAAPRVQRAVTLNGYDEQRILFTLKAPRREGPYRVQLELFSPDFKRRLHAQEPAFYATFSVGSGGERQIVRTEPPRPPEAVAGAAAMPAVPPVYSPPTGLSFEAPDVLWENFDISPLSFLAGDTGHIRADLRNVGGDIAKDIAVQVTYFNTRIPSRVQTIANSNVVALAPGDKIELEWEFAFPEDSLLGEYRVVLDARVKAGKAESNLANNRIVSERAIQLANIRLVFPDPNYLFDEAGLFLFRWESKLYDEFKVQVGVDKDFREDGKYFDIPQGEKWTKDQEIVPLEGELPVMAKGLMEREKSDVVYWRVVGRNLNTNRTAYSRVQSFRIHLTEPSPDQVPGPERMRPAPPPPASGGGQSPGGSEERMSPPPSQPPVQPQAPGGGAGTPAAPSTPQGQAAPPPQGGAPDNAPPEAPMAPSAPNAPGGASAPNPPTTSAPASPGPSAPAAQAPAGPAEPAQSAPAGPPPAPPAAAPARPAPGTPPALPPTEPPAAPTQ